MQIKIKTFEHEGSKYVSVEKITDDKWTERSFEYTDQDKIELILNLLEVELNKVIKDNLN